MSARRIGRMACAALPLCAVAALAATLPGEWRNWPWWRAIETPAVPGLVRVELPLEVLGRAQPGLDDLRVIDDGGSEVPWVSHRRAERAAVEWRDVPRVDSGFVAGSHSQVVLDLGEQGQPHNRVRVTTPREEFFAWVELAASENRVDWRVVRERAPLLRLGGGRAEERVLDFPETRSRWLRLRILDGQDRFVPDACEVAHAVETEPDVAMWEIAARRVAAGEEGKSAYEFDFDLPRAPVSLARFATAEASFHRPATLEAWDDAANDWRVLARGEVYRYETRVGDSEPRVAERSELAGTEGRGSRFRVTLEDGNDAPIADLRVTLGAERQRIGFPARDGRSYRLLYGNPQAEVPRYDLAVTTPSDEVPNAPAASLGPANRNEGYVSGEPWTERNRWVLWLALVVVVVVLGLVALRALR